MRPQGLPRRAQDRFRAGRGSRSDEGVERLPDLDEGDGERGAGDDEKAGEQTHAPDVTAKQDLAGSRCGQRGQEDRFGDGFHGDEGPVSGIDMSFIFNWMTDDPFKWLNCGVKAISRVEPAMAGSRCPLLNQMELQEALFDEILFRRWLFPTTVGV